MNYGNSYTERWKMTKYLLRWNVGFGDITDVMEADDVDSAHMLAYECWKEDAESQADYSAEVLTQELAENYGHEEEMEDE